MSMERQSRRAGRIISNFNAKTYGAERRLKPYLPLVPKLIAPCRIPGQKRRPRLEPNRPRNGARDTTKTSTLGSATESGTTIRDLIGRMRWRYVRVHKLCRRAESPQLGSWCIVSMRAEPSSRLARIGCTSPWRINGCARSTDCTTLP